MGEFRLRYQRAGLALSANADAPHGNAATL
jgi:hypothetical protein